MRLRVAAAVLALLALARPAPAEDVPAAPSFELVNGHLVLPGPVVFGEGSAEILAESEPALAQVLAFLAAKPSITKVRIESHVDGSVSAEERLPLTKARAAAVARWLVAKGAHCKRLMPVGFGDGGLGGKHREYTNVYWTLAGMHAAVEMAELLQQPAASQWKAEYEDYWQTFDRARQRVPGG